MQNLLFITIRATRQIAFLKYELSQAPSIPSAKASLFSFLGDQIVFLKGMFSQRDLEYALHLSAARVPHGIHSLADLASTSYELASEMILEDDYEPQAQRKSALFGRLSENVVDCIRGLKKVREELTYKAFRLDFKGPDLIVFG